MTSGKQYLSFGAGVNSVALYLLLKKKGIKFEAVFVNHETDYPETYEYVDYLRKEGFEITEVKPNYEGYSSLYEYCKFRKFLPSIYLRWCTYRFKLQPFWQYIATPCIVHVGISAEEKHRRTQHRKKGVTCRWLLVEEGINRRECKSIIRHSGLKVPRKSGCWLCPFQGKKQLRTLYRDHPRLFNNIVELEKTRGDRHSLKRQPITHYVAYNNKTLTVFQTTNLKQNKKASINE